MGGVAKKIFRKEILHFKRLLSEDEYNRRNQLLQYNVEKVMDGLEFTTLHLFLPMPRNREADTYPVLEKLSTSKSILISKTNFEKHQMDFYYYDPDMRLRESRFGIPEPENGQPADIQEADLLIIPLVAFDKGGHRLGYGGGYYDQLIGSVDPGIKKIGLSIGSAFDAFTFTEPHDKKMDACVTPFEILSFE